MIQRLYLRDLPAGKQARVSVYASQVVEADKSPSPSASRYLPIVTLLLFVIALVVTTVRGIESAASPFIYPHAFVSADVATAARTFATKGVFHLHGVPVNNNPPLGANDFYTHWPPLLPILLSIFFRFFGSTEQVSHLFMLGVLVATALLVLRLGQLWLGTVGGALAGYFWLTLPVVVQFGHLVDQQALGMLFFVAALVCFYSNRLRLGATILFFGVLSSWEIVLVVIGLWIATIWVRDLRFAATWATLGASMGVISIAVLFLLVSPGAAIDTLQAAKFYMGLSTVHSRISPNSQQISIAFTEQIHRMLLNNVWMIGPLGLAAIFQLFSSRTRKSALLLAALSAPWLIWCFAMPNHMARHEFEFVIAAPLAALALAWSATVCLRTTQSRTAAIKVGAFVALAAIQLVLLPTPHISDGYSPEGLVQYSLAIRASTEPGSIVMAPLVSAVPLYYSQRHIIREIDNGPSAVSEFHLIHRDFPNRPVYLAFPPFLAPNFEPKPPGTLTVASTPNAIILQFLDTKD